MPTHNLINVARFHPPPLQAGGCFLPPKALSHCDRCEICPRLLSPTPTPPVTLPSAQVHPSLPACWPEQPWQVLAPGLFSPLLSSTPRMLTSLQTLRCSSLSAGSPPPHPDPSPPNQSNPSKIKKLHSHPPLLHFHPVTPSGLLSASLGHQVPWHPITVMVSGTLQKY